MAKDPRSPRGRRGKSNRGILLGRIEKIESFGTFHRLLYVTFRGDDRAVYEDWEVDKVGR